MGWFSIKKIGIIIPCFNEELGIAEVMDSIPKKKLAELGYTTEVLVVDNNSTDNTIKIARSKGATVITEKRQGKGYALLTGFRNIPPDSHILVMIDGDGSYSLRELPRLLEPIDSGFGDVIVGTRLHGKLGHGSMTSFNRIGNWTFTFLARVCYKTNITDVCSGFFVWKREVIDSLTDNLECNGFSIEMEMITKMARMDYECYSVPISYDARKGKSSLRPIRDGTTILHAWVRNLFWKPGQHAPHKLPIIREAVVESKKAN